MALCFFSKEKRHNKSLLQFEEAASILRKINKCKSGTEKTVKQNAPKALPPRVRNILKRYTNQHHLPNMDKINNM